MISVTTMRVLRAALCFCLSFGIVAHAATDPLKIESDNIILYGDVDAESAQKIVRDLEIYRRTIFAMVNKDLGPAKVKLTIYSFDSPKPLSKYIGNKGTAGLYTNGADGPIFITSVKKTHREETFEEQVAKHEFSHHVLHAIVTDNFPRWYDEGFANYLSTFDVEGDIITVGAPKVTHGQALLRGRLMPVEDVLRSIRYYPWSKRGEGSSGLVNQFYAQSWLYVHYMQNTPEYGAALPDYLSRLQKGLDPLVAFEGAFGISPKDFHSKAKLYFAADAFPVLQFKAEPVFLNVEMTTEMISPAQLDLELLTGQANILSEDNKKNYRKRLDAAEEGLGQSARIMTAKAKLAVIDEDYKAAVIAAEAAHMTEPDNISLRRVLGDAYSGRSQAARFKDLSDSDIHFYEDNADLQTALGHYGEVLDVDPKNRQVVRSILRIYARSNVPLTDRVREATRYYENDIFEGRDPYAMIDFAYIYARDDKMDRACNYFKAARGEVKTVKTRSKTDLKSRVEAFAATYGEACAA